MQKIGAHYLAKRIADQLLAPPAQPATAAQPVEGEVAGGDLDGHVVHDEHGQPLGTAHRLRDVAVYVVADGYGDYEDELRRCLEDPEPRVFLYTEGARIAGLIYVPDPSRAPRRVSAIRSDEV